ncbi:MAG: Stk1 family PASTA domain-containing Ser/Thr kinase [Nocardioides sp.]
MTEDHIVIGGRYELGELLGRGGMAEVRKGMDLRLGRAVAIKRLRGDLIGDATFAARFRREAQSAAALNHPAIVAVYDTGEELSPDGRTPPQPYIVMEFVAGRTLRDVLREGRKILPERAMEISSGVLSALEYSHRAGIIHRDIKPANVMLTPSGDVKVMDFGIARAVSDVSGAMTQTAAVVGTAQYLSPEQARGETVDSRSDVYSAGCLLYELLTGRPPFVGDSPVSVAYQHVREPAVPPSMHDADLPAEVDAIVMKALAKRVDERYQSAAEMRADIERYLAGRPINAPQVGIPVNEPMPMNSQVYETGVRASTTTTSAAPVAPARRGRNGVGLWLLGGLIVAALVATYFLRPLFTEEEPKQVRVPALVGLTEGEARTAIGNAGLRVGSIEHEPDDTVPLDEVMRQDPDRDTYVDPGTSVNLVISLGKPQVQVPMVIGMDRKEARATLEARGLKVRFEESDSDLAAGQVLATDPAAGVSVEAGSTVVAQYSDGPETVPDVIGMTAKDAEEALLAAGFDPRIFESSDTTEEKGTVFDQSPGGGEDAPGGSTVTIFVSTYEPPKPTETPTNTVAPSASATP